MSKITLNQVGSLIDSTTAQTAINTNFTTIQTAFDNTLSRDGTAPDQLENSLDANNNQIINLPYPLTNNSPVRLTDLNTVISGGRITIIPTGGNTGDALVKRSNTNFDIEWSPDTSELTAGSNITITGTSPATIAVTSPMVTPNIGAATGTSLAASGLISAGTAAIGGATLAGNIFGVLGNSNLKGNTSVNSNSVNAFLVTQDGVGAHTAFEVDTTAASLAAGLYVHGAATGGPVSINVLDSGSSNSNLIIDAKGTGTIGIGSVSTGKVTITPQVNLGNLTASQSVQTDGSKNLVSVANTGSGNNVLATSPALTTPNIGVATATSVNKVTITQPATSATLTIPNGLTLAASNGQYTGTATNDSATAGNIGEYITANVAVGSAVNLTTATGANITSISLTAGDWDVSGSVWFSPAATTNVVQFTGSISSTTGTVDNSLDRQVNILAPTASGSVYGASHPTLVMGPTRFSLSGTTTIFLIGFASFTISTCAAYGIIRARRIR